VIRRCLVAVTAVLSIAVLSSTVLPPGLAGAQPDRPATAAEVSPGPNPPPAPPNTIGDGYRLHANVELSPDSLRRAARRCASWASKAGFTNNGKHGRLVTATAIALAESGCYTKACYNNTRGRQCTPGHTRHSRDSIDRGAWQINSHYWKRVTNRCAYHGLCSAKRAYVMVSEGGTYFRPWRTYTTGVYKRYIPAARAAVRHLKSGTLTSYFKRVCAAFPRDHRRAKVRVGRCGGAARDQQWFRYHAKLITHRHLCLGARYRHSGAVTLQKCNGRWRQQWWGRRGFSLYNRGAHRCLTDPGASRRRGHPLSVGKCIHRHRKRWFRP
jgi:lysozyme-like protein/ricin-type beta-trefoil lectin protein